MMNFIMGKRITIVLDNDLVKKLRDKQAKLIKESEKSVSFSRVGNDTSTFYHLMYSTGGGDLY